MNINVPQYCTCVISPGYIAICTEPTLVYAVSGNGVVVTIWDRVRRAGGMAHCIFPSRKFGAKMENYSIDVALPQLISAMCADGYGVQSMEAQLFGGASSGGYCVKRALKVMAVARRILKRRGIPIVSEDTGGSLGRKIIFNTRSGELVIVKTKRIRKTDWAPEYQIGSRE